MLLGASGGREDWTRPLPKGCRVRVPNVPLAVGDPAPWFRGPTRVFSPQTIDVKSVFTFFFILVTFFTFLTFFIFQTFFLFKKTLAKFRAASRLTRKTAATKYTYDFSVLHVE